MMEMHMKKLKLQDVAWALLVLQCVAVFFLMRPWQPNSDSTEYLQLAQALSNGAYGSVTPAGFEPEALRPPGYPLFLWLNLHVAHLPIAGVIVLQLLMYLASLYLVARYLRKRAIPPLLFLTLAVGYIFAAVYSSAVLAEAPAMLALTSAAVLLAGGEPGWRRLAAIGLICGLAILTRPDLLLLPVVVAGVVAGGAIWTKRIRQDFWKAAVPLVAAGLVLLPYSLWNYDKFGRLSPLPVAGAVGTSLYLSTWSHLPLEDLNALYRGEVTPRAREAGLGTAVAAVNREIGAPELTAPWTPYSYKTREQQIRATRVLAAAAVERIRADPGMYLRHVASNVWRLWNTSEYPARTPLPAEMALRLFSALVAALGLIGAGMSFLRVRDWPLPAGPAAILLYLPAVHVWLHTEARYTAPARPLLLMFAAVFLIWAWNRSGAGRFLPVRLQRMLGQ
jgi:hypothetical protein